MDILKQSIATNVPMADLMQQSQVAETPEQQQEGLRNQPEGTIMTFPESTGNFNTVGMDYPINIQKVSPQGDLVRSYENVPPGVESLPMGDDVGTVIETPANYQDGGFDAWKEALPSNLRDSDTTTYNLRGAYEAGLTPTIAPDGKYHLQSVNPKTLEFLKASDHKSTKEEIAWFENQKNTKALMGTPHPSTHKIVKDPSGYFGERSLKYVKKQEGDFKEDNIVIQNAQKAADEKEDFTRLSKTYFPPAGKNPSSFAGKVIDMLPTSAKINIAKAQPYIEKVIEASGPNQAVKIINNLAGGTYDGNFKFPGGMPICYGNTCVQSTSEILQRSGKWKGKLEQDNDAFAKNYTSHGYELVQEEDALPGDIVQFYKGTYDNRDYSHMGIHDKDGKYFNDGYFDKPWHKKNEPTTAELMKNSKIPLNEKAIGKVYYRYKKE